MNFNHAAKLLNLYLLSAEDFEIHAVSTMQHEKYAEMDGRITNEAKIY